MTAIEYEGDPPCEHGVWYDGQGQPICAFPSMHAELRESELVYVVEDGDRQAEMSLQFDSAADARAWFDASLRRIIGGWALPGDGRVVYARIGEEVWMDGWPEEEDK